MTVETKTKTKKYIQPLSMVDTVIFTVLDQSLHVLLVKRSIEPFKDMWSLVGGFINTQIDNSLLETAKRKLLEKTGVKTPYLEQLECIGDNVRDPRGWSVTHVYFALLPHESVKLQLGRGAQDIEWVKIQNDNVDRKLAFDHQMILEKATKRLKNKVLYTSLPVFLMPDKFTLRQFQTFYEVILGESIEHKSFRRRMLKAGILIETDEMSQDRGRPAKLYRVRKDEPTYYFARILEGVR